MFIAPVKKNFPTHAWVGKEHEDLEVVFYKNYSFLPASSLLAMPRGGILTVAAL
jgi:hypothetical protein